MAKSDDMYWTPVGVAVPDDDRQVLLCKQSKNGAISYTLGYYDGAGFVTMGCAKVTHWIDFPDVREHTDQLWNNIKHTSGPTGRKWRCSDDKEE